MAPRPGFEGNSWIYRHHIDTVICIITFNGLLNNILSLLQNVIEFVLKKVIVISTVQCT